MIFALRGPLSVFRFFGSTDGGLTCLHFIVGNSENEQNCNSYFSRKGAKSAKCI
jgi:hypothetical protein